MPNPLSIQIGERYGRWTIIKAVPSYKKVRRFQCKCDCGSRELGFNHKTLEKRIKKWGVERAFTTPIQVEFQRKRKSS